MKQGYWGFVAGMIFAAALMTFEIWGITPRSSDGGTAYGAGFAADLRDC